MRAIVYMINGIIHLSSEGQSLEIEPQIVALRLMVKLCLVLCSVRHSSAAHNQIFISQPAPGLLMSGALSEECMRLQNLKGSDGGVWQTKTTWPLVRERTIPTERPPLVDEI
jgi:hypothetical protein